MTLLRTGSLAPLALAFGCASAPDPLPDLKAPQHAVATSLRPGSLLSGTRAVPTDASSDADLRIRVLYIDEDPPEGARHVAAEAAVLADLTGGVPVLETPKLTAEATVLHGPEARDWILGFEPEGPDAAVRRDTLYDEERYLPIGTTLRVDLSWRETVRDPRDWLGEFPPRGPFDARLGFAVESSPEGLRLALERRGLDPETEAELVAAFHDEPDLPATPPPPAYEEDLLHEVIVLPDVYSTDETVVGFLPSPFQGDGHREVAILIEPEEGDAGRAERRDDAAALLGIDAARDAKPITDADREAIGHREALRHFRESGGRAALLHISDATNAPLSAELALVADEDFLADLAEAALGPGGGDEAVGDELAWRLDSTAWSMLASAAIEETLDPELVGVTYRRAGAVASFPDLVLDAVAAARGSLATLDERLVAENLYFLEDAAPSARVRAHEWLVERGRAIDGYDPMGERADRRAALAAARAGDQGGDER